MVLTLLSFKLQHLLKKPTLFFLMGLFVFIVAVFENQFVFDFIGQQNNSSIALHISGQLFAPLWGLSLILLLLLTPFLCAQIHAQDNDAGLNRLLTSFAVTKVQFWTINWIILLVFILFFHGLLFLLHSIILFSSKTDWPVYLTQLLGHLLSCLLFSSICLGFSMFLRTSRWVILSGFSLLFIFWLITLLTQELPQLNYVLSSFNFFQWYAASFRVGLIVSQHLLSLILIILGLFFIFCVFLKLPRYSLLIKSLSLSCLIILLFVIQFLPFTQIDVTSNQRHSLHPQLIQQVSHYQNIQMTSFQLDDASRQEIQQRLLHPLQAITEQITIQHKVHAPQVNTHHHITQEKTAGVLLELDNTPVWLDYPFQHHPQYLLSHALFNLKNKKQRYIAFIEGHNEASLHDNKQHSLSHLNTLLKQHHWQPVSIHLSRVETIADNVSLVVIASSKQSWQPDEIDKLFAFLARGGNLLWLRDPDDTTLQKLEDWLHLIKIDGTLMDALGYQKGTPHPAIVLIDQFTQHPVTHSLNSLVAFPWSSALAVSNKSDKTRWQVQPILTTHPKVWTEFTPTEQSLQLNEDQGELEGAFHLLLEWRSLLNNEQRIIVSGDSHFLSNSAIHNYDNQQFSLNLFSYLTQSHQMNIQLIEPVDKVLLLTTLGRHLIGWLMPFVMPVLFLFIGAYLWYKPRRA